MTLSDNFLALESRLAAKFGAAGTLTRPANVYDTDGTVSGDPVSVAVIVDGPKDESRRYAATGADSRITATLYIPALNLTMAPQMADEVTFAGKTWKVYGLGTNYVQGVVTSYRLDCGVISG